MTSSITYSIQKFNSSGIENTEDQLAVEEPLEIQLLYGNKDNRVKKNISVTMRTPGNDEELGVGFLFTESIIQKRKQVSEVKLYQFSENKVLITLCENEIPMLQKTERNFYTTSSCG
ncbi:MAG: formate dehydrogenase accessory sulfurtransferase FdhD, partial [bacterium]